MGNIVGKVTHDIISEIHKDSCTWELNVKGWFFFKHYVWCRSCKCCQSNQDAKENHTNYNCEWISEKNEIGGCVWRRICYCNAKYVGLQIVSSGSSSIGNYV